MRSQGTGGGGNRELSKRVGDTLRSGRLMPAIVVDVFQDKATVRLGGTGSVLRGLDVIGGPVEAGQSVHVDFTTPTPTIVFKSKEGLTSSDLATALKKLSEEGISGETQIRITLFSGGGIVDMFDPSASGLTSALLTASNGDVIFCPDIDVETDCTIPDGISVVGISSRQTIIRGKVTLGLDTSLENLSVIAAVRTANEVNAIVAPGTGLPSWIKDCEIHAYNCGTGIANAVKIAADTDRLQITNSVIVADAAENSTAHAFDGAGGVCYVSDSRVYSKSAENFNGTTFYVHSNISHVSEIDRACVPVVSEDPKQMRYSPTPEKHGSMPRQAWSSVTKYQFIDELTGYYHQDGTIAKYEEFVYHDFTNGSSGNRTIREVRTTDGNTIDVVLWTGAPYGYTLERTVAVTKRELNVLYHNTSTGKIRVYKVNFETETSVMVFETDDELDAGDPVTGIGYKDVSNLGMIHVKADDGDLYLVIFGIYSEFTREDIDYGDVYASGAVFWVKNWTQNSGWQKHEGNHWVSDTVAQYQLTTSPIAVTVDGQYVVLSATFQFDNIASDISAIGMWSYDIINEEIKQDIKTQVPRYSSFSPTPGILGAAHVDGCAYALYNGGDYDYSGASWDVVYKYNPVNGSMAEYQRAPANTQYLQLFSNKSGVYMWQSTSGVYDFMELSGKTLISEDVTFPTYNSYSNLLNDSNEIIAYETATGLISLFNIFTDVIVTVDVDLEADTVGFSPTIRQSDGCYVIYFDKWIGPGSNYETKAWLIVDGA